MLFRLILFVLLACSSFAAPAGAQEYIAPSWADLTRTMVRFNALNLSDPVLIDEYAIVTECDLYKAFYKNDFKWNEVRQAVRKSVQINAVTYPMNYYYDVKLQLDRYDFDAKIFRFTQRSALRNVNSFLLYAVEGTGCGTADVKYLPRAFHAVLALPIYLDGLPLAEPDAQALYKQMSDDRNTDRIIYAHFNLRVVYVDPLHKVTTRTGNNEVTRYEQSNSSDLLSVRMDVRLDSIDFYEDPQMTRLIYRYQS